MNFNKFINSDYLKNNPLCGISTYKDELNLATGDCTRKIKKLVLDGTEGFSEPGTYPGGYLYMFRPSDIPGDNGKNAVSTHYKQAYNNYGQNVYIQNGRIVIIDAAHSTRDDFKAYLAQQYTNGTPVTVWYVLGTPTTETVTVPTGLSGTEEGYLNQSGTPTPTNPIYPTANTVEKWFDINHYIMKTATDTFTTLPAVLYPNDTTATVGLKGNTLQSSVPSPVSPVMPNGTGERTGNLFNVNRQASNTWTIDDKYYIDGVVGDSKSSIRPDTVDVSISNSGDLTVTARSYYGAGFVVAVTPNTTYTLSFAKDTVVPNSKSIATITYVDADENFLNYVTVYGGATQVTFTTPNTAYYIFIAFRYINDTLTYSDIMLNLGSTALPYEPFGVKIPISSGGVNLFDDSTIEIGGLDINTGAEVANSSRRRSDFIKVTPSTAYTLTRVLNTSNKSNLWIIGYDANKNVISDSVGTRPTVLASISENITLSSFDTTPSTEYIRWYVTANGSYSDIMLNLGSTPLPYEPYNRTTTPVYLGEVQTTRKIKKLVLTGEEDITSTHTDISLFNIPVNDYLKIANVVTNVCTHYLAGTNISGWADATDKTSRFYANPASPTKLLYIRDSSYTTVADFKTYLAQQYANGTPVTVWYVLATEETAVVNEPLMKIGDYADILSNATAIPTTEGANTISVDTTVQPSEFTATWTGWHDASVKEWDGSQWNE